MKKNKHHKEADNFAKTTDERLVTTYPVITEVCHILLKRQGIKAQLNFVAMYQLGAFEVFEIPKKDKGRMLLLMQQYADLPMDFADASLVALGEELGIDCVFTLDSDFLIYRMSKGKVFHIFPEQT